MEHHTFVTSEWAVTRSIRVSIATFLVYVSHWYLPIRFSWKCLQSIILYNWMSSFFIQRSQSEVKYDEGDLVRLIYSCYVDNFQNWAAWHPAEPRKSVRENDFRESDLGDTSTFWSFPRGGNGGKGGSRKSCSQSLILFSELLIEIARARVLLLECIGFLDIPAMLFRGGQKRFRSQLGPQANKFLRFLL